MNRAALLGIVLLAGCAGVEPAAPPYQCLLPGEQRMLVAELFFGRVIAGRTPLSDMDWQDFAVGNLTPNFPAGFTVMDGEGQWQNPATGRISHEPTKIVTIATPRAFDLAARLSAVMDAYKARYRQQSVGLITRDSCAAF